MPVKKKIRKKIKAIHIKVKKILNKKIPCISTLSHQGKYVIDFKKKAELLNFFFAKQCSIIQNSSKLPLTLSKNIKKSISSITFSCNDIATITCSIDTNKAHGYDMMSIRMLKMYGTPIW